MRSGTWKSVKRVQTHVWLMLKIVKFSGWIFVTSLSYAMASPHPFRSLKPLVCIAPVGSNELLGPGHGLLPSRTSPPGEEAKNEVRPLSHANSAVAGLPAGNSK